MPQIANGKLNNSARVSELAEMFSEWYDHRHGNGSEQQTL